MYKTFGYRFIKGPQLAPAQIHSLGWQLQNSAAYSFDGMKRHDEEGNCIFQYTLSGFGAIEYGGSRHVLDKGSAFIAAIPSEHRYYLPKDSHKWEFIFITLTGDYAISQWKKTQEQFGAVLKFKEQDEVIKYLWETYWAAANNKIIDGYQSSSNAYEFIMRLDRSLNFKSVSGSTNDRNIRSAVSFMKDNLHRDICLDDIANYVNMSKYHFNHTFTKVMGISPWSYLTKLRIEHAMKLLLSTNLTVDEISGMVGYSSSNYFNKVFRKYIGTSPGKLREKYTNIKDFTVNL